MTISHTNRNANDTEPQQSARSIEASQGPAELEVSRPTISPYNHIGQQAPSSTGASDDHSTSSSVALPAPEAGSDASNAGTSTASTPAPAYDEDGYESANDPA